MSAESIVAKVAYEQSINDKLFALEKNQKNAVKSHMKKYGLNFDDALRLRECTDRMKEMRTENKQYATLEEYQDLLAESRAIRDQNRDPVALPTRGRMSVDRLMQRYSITEEAAQELYDNKTRRDELQNEIQRLLNRARELRSKACVSNSGVCDSSGSASAADTQSSDED